MSDAIEVPVPLADHSYRVVVGSGLLTCAGARIRDVSKASRCALVTDSIVGPLYAETVRRSLEESGFDVVIITVPSGESSKSLTQVAFVCDAMIAAGLDRSALLVALGGGVVGDLAGFVAAIYYRGIPFVQIPTTIVAQVDSSIGGKTGVNAAGGKNLLGAFHQPVLVLADVSTLSTLPEREFNEGFAEVIKHAAIRDRAMLDHLDDLTSLVARNVAIKAAIVTEDEFETKGVRALLNFGHTIGHGIEAAAGYGRFLHGEAISLGLVAACRLSVQKAGLPSGDAALLISMLARYRLPLQLPGDISTDNILQALRKDKKFHAGAVRFVLLRALGEAFVSSEITEKDVVNAIEGLR
jgi:3-dehydroquinate synthase